MGNYSDVPCDEVLGTASESYDDDKGLMKASVQLKCEWVNRHLLVADVCGNRKQWPKGAAGVVPMACTAAIVPFGNVLGTDGQEIVYEDAHVTINYSTEIKDIASESIEPTAEFLTLDYRAFRWGSGSGDLLKEDEAPGRLVRGINFVRNEYNVIVLPSGVLSLIGKVNQATVVGSIINLTFPAETLLYAPPAISYKQDSTNTVKFDLTKKFTYNAEGWNKYYRGSTGAWSEIYVAGSPTPYKSYVPGDFSGLLT